MYWNIKFLALLLAIPALRLFAQQTTPTYYTDIQPLLQQHCTGCHYPGGAGPFALMTYEDVAQRGDMIRKVTALRYMPPWPADPTFRRFHQQNTLTDEEIARIADWVSQGKAKGKTPKKKFQNLPGASLLDPGPHDLVIEMDSTFTLPADSKEQYRLFILPTHTRQDLYVRAIAYEPGNRSVTHHCRIMIDTSNALRGEHRKAVDEVPEFEQINIPLADPFWQGWVPGNLPVFYPDGAAKLLPAGADLVLNVHYAPTPVGVSDRPKVKLWLAKTPPEKQVRTFAIGENAITNPPFVLYPGTKPTFYMRSAVLREDIKLVSILPHMHLLGKNFRAYAITPGGGIVPLIQINNWEFQWQMTYRFEEPLLLKKGSVIYAEAQFDNTAQNPLNPYSPPQKITYGWGVKNEMMNLILEYITVK